MHQNTKTYVWKRIRQHCSKYRETESISSQILNETRVLILFILTHTALNVLIYSSNIRERLKGIQTGKEEVKMSLFTDYMILYLPHLYVSNKQH